MLDQFQNCYHI